MSENIQIVKRYTGLCVTVLFVSLVGYLTYLLYPRFSLPGAADLGLLLLAIMAGLASLFSPCSFPLLVTLLARESSERGRLVRSAGAFTAGAALFLLLLGVALALGASNWITSVTFTSVIGRMLRTIIGLLLIGFGLWQIRGQAIRFCWFNRLLDPLWRKQAQLRRQKKMLSYGLYGFGYILAGFG